MLRKRHLAGEISEPTLLELLDVCRNELIKLLEEGAAMAGKGWGEQARTARTCQRILKLEAEPMEPTNHAAERALRPLVTQRKVLYGTQSERGSRFQERMHSVLATCKQQGKSAVDVCVRALQAHFGAGDVPVLSPG